MKSGLEKSSTTTISSIRSNAATIDSISHRNSFVSLCVIMATVILTLIASLTCQLRQGAWPVGRQQTEACIDTGASQGLAPHLPQGGRWSKHRIARRLNEQRIETWGTGKRKAPHWRSSYVAKLLSNSAVVGTFTPHKVLKVSNGARKHG